MASSTPKARLENKVTIVTGGARGIGECIVRLFVKHGVKVVIANVKDDLGELVCQELGSEFASFVHWIVDEPKLSILDNEKSDFERVVNINLGGVFLGTKHAARVMIPICSGSIITIASISSVTGGVATHAYTSSKHGVVGLAKNAAAELGKYNIRENCVSPYVVPTKMAFKFLNMEETSGFYSNLNGKTLRQQDIANAALFLASDKSGYVSGHNLVVDGGYSVLNPAFGLFSWKP
ncbi:secoisolariciresinol dehydrogenase-like protein [Tanacetum coccineum]